MNRLSAAHISKSFRIGTTAASNSFDKYVRLLSGKEAKKTLWALQNISFSLKAGESLVLIGPNGAGKTTLLKIISGIYSQDTGSYTTNGIVVPMIGLYETIKDRLSLRDNVRLLCTVLGLTQTKITARMSAIIDFAELQDYAETKLYQFSQGMVARAIIAIILHCDPDLLIVDEFFLELDFDFTQKTIATIKKKLAHNMAFIASSHTEWLIRLFDRALYIDNGEKIIDDTPDIVLTHYCPHTMKPD